MTDFDIDKIDKIYMYILVNNDLKMTKGKIASQVGHVVGLITEDILTKYYESHKGIPDSYLRYTNWKANGEGKIILKATEEQIKKLVGEKESIYIIDEGKTQIEKGSLTVIGFYPKANLSKKFSNYKLL